MRVLDGREEARRLAIYRTAASDSDAGRKLGCYESTFRNWRKRRGLPSKNAPPILSAEQIKERLSAWAEEPNVQDAARRLGLNAGTYDSWLRGQGLRSRLGLQADTKIASKQVRYLRAYHEARTDSEAAQLLGVPSHAFARWRRRNKLPPTGEASIQRFRTRKAAANRI